MEIAMKPILIVGSYLSPYVRKVLACLEVKGIAYEVDHIVPFFGDDRFSRLSPLRPIPVLVDGDLVLSDSSVICQYLEDRQPAPALFPSDIADRARARWLEEFADTRMGDVFIWRYFNQIAIRPTVWGEKGDREMVDRTLKEEIPAVLDYLESEAPADERGGGFRFGALSVADIAIAAFFRNAGFVRFQIDAARWPRTAAWIGRTLASPAFAKLAKIEDAILRVPVPEQRAALKALGAPVSVETYGGAAPRRGIMPI
jgi:glutathione S-transferase